MKMRTLANKAKKELKNEKEEAALELIKRSIKEVKAAEKTLKILKKEHEKLLKMDLDDLELEGFEY